MPGCIIFKPFMIFASMECVLYFLIHYSHPPESVLIPGHNMTYLC